MVGREDTGCQQAHETALTGHLHVGREKVNCGAQLSFSSVL